MEDRFDRLEGKIDALITTVNHKFAVVDRTFEGLETRLGARIDGVEDKLGGLSGELRAVETRLRGHIEAVEEKVDRVNDRVRDLDRFDRRGRHGAQPPAASRIATRHQSRARAERVDSRLGRPPHPSHFPGPAPLQTRDDDAMFASFFLPGGAA